MYFWVHRKLEFLEYKVYISFLSCEQVVVGKTQRFVLGYFEIAEEKYKNVLVDVLGTKLAYFFLFSLRADSIDEYCFYHGIKCQLSHLGIRL